MGAKDLGTFAFECSGLYDFKCPSNCTGCAGLPDNSCYEYDDVSVEGIANPMICKSWGGRDCKVVEGPQDVCKKYDGIPHKSKPVCCHKSCPNCGGKNWTSMWKKWTKSSMQN